MSRSVQAIKGSDRGVAEMKRNDMLATCTNSNCLRCRYSAVGSGPDRRPIMALATPSLQHDTYGSFAEMSFVE